MRTHYLHLFAFTCIKCNGPVISGYVATRETDIQRESDIRQVGSVCLSCGKRYGSLPLSHKVRHIAPFEWHTTEPAKMKVIAPLEVASVV